jgi:hypothetical protein
MNRPGTPPIRNMPCQPERVEERGASHDEARAQVPPGKRDALETSDEI